MPNELMIQSDDARSVSTQAMVFDPAVIAGMQRMAEMMAGARVTIPKHLQGSPADCLAVIMQAAQFKLNPFAVAQKTHIVNGALGYEAQLVNAVVCSSGAIRGRFHYEYRGDGPNIECRVGAIPAGEHEIVWGEWLSAASVTTKNSPLWKTNPKQQLGYLQVKNWARQYAPGAILGVYSADELADAAPRDMGHAEIVEDPAASRTESVKARLAARRGPEQEQEPPVAAAAADPEPPEEPEKPAKAERSISKARHRRLEALLNESGIPRERVKAWLARKDPERYASVDEVHLNEITPAVADLIEVNIPRFVEALAREATPSEEEIATALDEAVDVYGWNGTLDDLATLADRLEHIAADLRCDDDQAEPDRLAGIAKALRAHFEVHRESVERDQD